MSDHLAFEDDLKNDPAEPVEFSADALDGRLPLTPEMIAAGAAVGRKYFHELNPADWWFARLARETFKAMAEAAGYVVREDAKETQGEE